MSDTAVAQQTATLEFPEKVRQGSHLLKIDYAGNAGS